MDGDGFDEELFSMVSVEGIECHEEGGADGNR